MFTDCHWNWLLLLWNDSAYLPTTWKYFKDQSVGSRADVVTQRVKGLTAKPADPNSILGIHVVVGERKLSSPKLFSDFLMYLMQGTTSTPWHLTNPPKQTINKWNLKIGGEGGGRLRVHLKLQGNMQWSLILLFPETFLEYKLYLPVPGARHS